MEIKSQLKNRSGQILNLVYRDADSFSELGERVIFGVHGYCFYGEKLVVVYAAAKGYWTPPGGAIEERETIEEAITREVKEETNMKVLYQELLGYQDIYQPNGIVRQTRSFCLVEPYGDFVSDPDLDVTEIKLIDPKDYKQYFDWGTVGKHLMKRALEVKERTK